MTGTSRGDEDDDAGNRRGKGGGGGGDMTLARANASLPTAAAALVFVKRLESILCCMIVARGCGGGCCSPVIKCVTSLCPSLTSTPGTERRK